MTTTSSSTAVEASTGAATGAATGAVGSGAAVVSASTAAAKSLGRRAAAVRDAETTFWRIAGGEMRAAVAVAARGAQRALIEACILL